jgi:hypothetical protein
LSLIGLVVALTSCGVPDGPPNIVLISIDSLRADRLGTYQGSEEFSPSGGTHYRSHRDRSASEVVDAALAWMQSYIESSQPWFLFVHIWDVHYDYDPPAPFDSIFDPDDAGNLDPVHFKHNPAIHAGMPARDLDHQRALYDGRYAGSIRSSRDCSTHFEREKATKRS